MLFNSIDFAIFLPIVFLLYWVFSKNVKIQNLFLLAASYFFYAWWDWRYLSLVIICSITNYMGGRLMMQTDKQKMRKYILIVCCLISLGILGFFKYYNFFITSLVDTFSIFGFHIHAHTLHLILPVGISFYTFHTLSYTIDVYRRKFEPTQNVVSFFLFVSIFPLAMAGPIERAGNLLPQIYKRRSFNYAQATDGMRQILWGLFKKIVIADNCAQIVNATFADYGSMSGSMLLIGAIFFSFQIYGDFSGYSDMALGIGKLLGFNFLRNFNYPYFSRNIAEFWRRWHISLTTWFRDYVYIPLGGNRVSKWKIIRNTFIVFLISGLWHGANWTFVIWGVFHASLFISLILIKRNKAFSTPIGENRIFPNFLEVLQISITFGLVLVGWIFFRSENIGMAIEYFEGMLQLNTFKAFYLILLEPVFWYCVLMLVVEWIQRNKQHGLEMESSKGKVAFRWMAYIAILLFIILAGVFEGDNQFIYFQF